MFPLLLALLLTWPPGGDALLFELDFDRSGVQAGISGGRRQPLQVFGTPEWRPGLRGQALLCGAGGAKLRFATAGNLDFDRPGSVSFWFCPLDWDADYRYRTFFFGTESSQGYFGIQQANDPKHLKPYDRDLHLLILYSPVIRATTLALPPFRRAGLRQWHLVAAAWDGRRVFLSLDGAPFSSWELSAPVSRSALPSAHFSVGADSEWNYLLDEFRIYGRRLGDAEVQAIFRQGGGGMVSNKAE